jgi:endoglucanase
VRVFSFAPLAVSAVVSLTAPVYSSPMAITTPAGFELKRGVNLSHWLSQNFGWSPKDTFITENDIAFIASVGYDHVRIPIDEVEMWSADGKPIEESFSYLTRCLDWCQKLNLRAIVDLHILRAHFFNAPNDGSQVNTLWTDRAAQDNFIMLWIQLSERLSKFPVDRVAYEPMNEPVADDPADWNKLVAKVVKAIRKLEPDRVIVIGANRWQTPANFPYLEIPPNDRYIVLSLHTYAPMFFTHHTAYWVPFKDYTGPVHYPGQVVADADLEKYLASGGHEDAMGSIHEARQIWNKRKLASSLKPAIDRAKELGLPLYCGEFGCLPHVDRAQRLKYYDDLIAVFEKNNIAWCNWELKGDFGICKFDFATNASLEPDDELIRVLTRKR